MPSQELILVLPYTLVRHISHATFFCADVCGALRRAAKAVLLLYAAVALLPSVALQRSQTTLTLHAAGFVEFNLTKKKRFSFFAFVTLQNELHVHSLMSCKNTYA